MSKKNKFDLTHLVHAGHLKEGEVLNFLSDPSKTIKLIKQPSGEFKVDFSGEITTVHAAAQKCLGQEPPDHASRWFRNSKGKTLYEIWQMDIDAQRAA